MNKKSFMRKGEILLTAVIVILGSLIIGQLHYSNSLFDSDECMTEVCDNDNNCTSMTCDQHESLNNSCDPR